MAIQDYEQLFKCPKCGGPTSIFLIKNSGANVVIKHRCPEHGGQKVVVPFKDKHFYLDLIYNGVYRCFKCGQRSSLHSVEFDGPWALVSCFCPTHGTDVKVQKIWNSFFIELQNPEFVGEIPKQTSIQESKVEMEEETVEEEVIEMEEPVSEFKEDDKRFCPNCGAQLHGQEKFCGECGINLESE